MEGIRKKYDSDFFKPPKNAKRIFLSESLKRLLKSRLNPNRYYTGSVQQRLRCLSVSSLALQAARKPICFPLALLFFNFMEFKLSNLILPLTIESFLSTAIELTILNILTQRY